MRVLVTGSTGFIGVALTEALRAKGIVVRAAVRLAPADLPADVEQVQTGPITPASDWRMALEGVDAVVHLAARVHVMRDRVADPLTEYRRTNADATLALARQAVAAGVRRFVFVSSVKVNGEETQPGQPFTELDPPGPKDAYGLSKLEAEERLFDVAAATPMHVVCVRPPLVYGPGAKANFLAMAQWLRSGFPLPLGSLDRNRRSLVALDNLVDLLTISLVHPAAVGQVFLVSDGDDLSTTELLHRTARAIGRAPPRLIPVPPLLLGAGAAIIGKRDLYQRLCRSLQVDITKARRVLGWAPVISVDEGLRRAVSNAQVRGASQGS